jgi:hypothetical protein
MLQKLKYFSIIAFCFIALTAAYRENTIQTFEVDNSTSKLYLSPSKIGWFSINDDYREIVIKYTKTSETVKFYESKTLIVEEKGNSLKIVTKLDNMYQLYIIQENKLILKESGKLFSHKN